MRKPFIKIKLKDYGGYTERPENMGNFVDMITDIPELKDDEHSDIYEVSVIFMKEEEYKKLPEFMGF